MFGLLVTFGAQGTVLADGEQIRLALLPVGQPGSFFDLVMLPGDSRTLAVDISNDGAAPLAARTYAADVYTIINGGFGGRLHDEPETGTTRWLDYATDGLQLDAGERVRRTFEVVVPADAGPGEYITSLVLEYDQSVSGGGGVGFNQVVRQAVAVVVTVPGQRAPGLAIGTASHKVVGGLSVVSVAVRNTGNVRTKPLVQFALFDAAGDQVSQATVRMDTFYAHTDTFIELPLAALLLPGTYTVSLTLEDAEQGARAAEAAIPFIVEAPGSSAGAVGLVPGPIDVIQGGPHPVAAAVVTAGLVLAAGLAMLILLRGHRRPRSSER
jgi:hypothetical protein